MPRTTKLITVSLPPDLATLAEKVCREEGRTKSELLREALREYVLTRHVRRAARRRLAEILAQLPGRGREADATEMARAVQSAIGSVRKRRAAVRSYA